jgi:hypothetical protein
MQGSPQRPRAITIAPQRATRRGRFLREMVGRPMLTLDECRLVACHRFDSAGAARAAALRSKRFNQKRPSLLPLRRIAATTGILLLVIVTPMFARGADQTVPGAGNQAAQQLAGRSPLVSSAVTLIAEQIARIGDPALAGATLDALTNPQTCIAHRVHVSEANKAEILQALMAAELVDRADESTFPGGLKAGIFPPLPDETEGCPHLPQPFGSAPGSVFGGHHSYPGGLAVHVAFNISSDLSLADNYRKIYGGTASNGLAEIAASVPVKPAILIDQDIIIAAPAWHDWAKTMVFQWNEDGSEFAELNFGGNGKTDNYGAPGNSKTGAHHILGVAETIARKLPPAFVVTQASAHVAPTSGNEFQVVNWIRAAALIGGVDPVAAGYLVKDGFGRLRLPLLREQATLDIQAVLPGQSNLLVEYALQNLSDADFNFTVPAMAQAEQLLAALASKFGYNPKERATYNTRYRNPTLAYLSAERLQIIYAGVGLDAVASELAKLKALGII